MATNRVPIFVNTVNTHVVSIATADTSLTAPAAAGTIYTNSSGLAALVSRIRGKAMGSTTASMVRIFLHDGTTYYLWREYLTDTLVASGTVKSFEFDEEVQLYLPDEWSLRATTHGGDDFMIYADVGEYTYAE